MGNIQRHLLEGGSYIFQGSNWLLLKDNGKNQLTMERHKTDRCIFYIDYVDDLISIKNFYGKFIKIDTETDKVYFTRNEEEEILFKPLYFDNNSVAFLSSHNTLLSYDDDSKTLIQVEYVEDHIPESSLFWFSNV